jgi:hypothetical protein
VWSVRSRSTVTTAGTFFQSGVVIVMWTRRRSLNARSGDAGTGGGGAFEDVTNACSRKPANPAATLTRITAVQTTRRTNDRPE